MFLKSDINDKELLSNIYSFFSKFGFNDGDQILEGEELIAKELAYRLIDLINIVDYWKPVIIRTSNNPYCICFKDLRDDEISNFWDLSEIEKRKIEQRLTEIGY